jgi:cytochrome P450
MPELLNLKLDKVLFSKLIEGVNRFTSLSASIFQWRFAQTACNDLFSALLEAKDPETGHGFSTDQLISEAGLLTIAGSDTTITATTATFFYLTHYPKCLHRVQADIRDCFAEVEDIRIGPLLASCCYLAACIKESLRISPPVGSTLMREVLPGGLTVDGEWFPPGTDIGVPHYALHHDETYFADASVFRPERWLSNNSHHSSTDASAEMEMFFESGVSNDIGTAGTADAAFTAFGVGRTSCIGKYLAYQEISLVVARTLWLYDMRKEPGTALGEGHKGLGRERWTNEFQTLDRFVSVHEGPSLQFKRRKYSTF